MSDLAQIGFSADTSGLVNAKKGLDDVSTAAAKTEQSTKRATDQLDKIGTSGNKATGNVLELTKGMKYLAEISEKAAASASNAASSAGTVAAGATKAGAAVEHLGGVSSTTTRELVVMAREAGRGNFSQMAGSVSILVQSLGLMQYILNPVTLVLITLTAITIGLAAAFINASIQADRFNNIMKLTGNYAGLTATSYVDLANKTASATNTTVAGNEKMIASLAGTNKFTKDQIADLVISADLLGERTGQNADKVLAGFEKMADGPGKYADELLQKYTGVITPAIVAHIHELEDTGHAQEALGVLIRAQMQGIANATVEGSNIMVRAWNTATNAVSNYYTNLKTWLTRRETWKDASDIQSTNVSVLSWVQKYLPATAEDKKNIADMIAQNQGGADRAAVMQKKQDDAAVATQKHTAVIKEQADALAFLSSNYGSGYDSIDKFKNHVAQLDAYLAKADKSNPQVKEMLAHRADIVEGIRQQDLPKAYGAANAKTKRTPRASTALSGFDVIENTGDNDIAKLQATADGYNMTALAAATLAEKTKLLSDAASKGMTLTDAQKASIDRLAASYGAAKVAADEAKALFDINAEADKAIATLDQQAATIGLVGRQLAYATEMQKLLNDAQAKKLPVTASVTADFQGKANTFADKSAANATLKSYTDQINAANELNTTQQAELATIGMSEEATAAYTFAVKLQNDEIYRGITYSPQQIAGLKAIAAENTNTAIAIAKTKDALALAKDATKGFVQDLKSGLLQGQNAFEAFGNAAINVLNKVLDKILDMSIDNLFGGKSAGSGIGGFLGSVLGAFGLSGGGPSFAGVSAGNNAALDSIAGSIRPPGFAKGGSYTNSVVNSRTPFTFANGAAMGEMGEAGPEAIMPLQRGPDGSLGVQMYGAGNGGGASHINAPVTVLNTFPISGAISPPEIQAAIEQSAARVTQQIKKSVMPWIQQHQSDGAIVS